MPEQSLSSIPVITVDGPSGAGKGTLCQLLAGKLGFHLLDSGAIYRVTALAAQRASMDLHDEDAVAEVALSLPLTFELGEQGVEALLAGDNVSREIRLETAGMGASIVAAHPKVRAALLARQRAFLEAPGLVADGRDMGTTVFPNATLKIFLTASAEERANRRYKQLLDKGESVSLRALLEELQARDQQDKARSASPLVPAEDAISIDSSSLSIDEVLNEVLALVNTRLSLPA